MQLCFLLLSWLFLQSVARHIPYDLEEIQNEELSNIPTDLSKNLKSMKIINSTLVSLENLSNYPQLELLEITDSRIFLLNETFYEITKLHHLRKLTFDGCSIKTFDLEKLPNLLDLNLSNNPGIKIYGSGKWSKLTALNLSNNNLAQFPEPIKDLRLVETLIIDGNLFQTIPNYFEKFYHLKNIMAHENPLKNVPDSLKSKVKRDILEEKITENKVSEDFKVTDNTILIWIIVGLTIIIVLLMAIGISFLKLGK